MRLKNVVAVLGTISAAVMPVMASASQGIGAVSAASGNSFVSRDGRLLRATPSMQLYAGDRVITQGGSSAKVALNGGCSVAVGASSMASLSSCASGKPADVTRAGYQGGTSALQGRSGGGIVVGVLALAAIIAGIIFATRHNNGNGRPNSV